MGRYLLRKFTTAFITLLAVVALIFAALKLVPGGPFDGETALPADVKAALEARFGLAAPWPVQFMRYVAGTLHGDFGISLASGGVRPVADLIAEGLPLSVMLGIAALVLTLVGGIFCGVILAARVHPVLRGVLRFALALCLGTPVYVVAALLVFTFALHWPLLPAALWEGPSSLVLPALTLACRPMALVGRLMGASLSEAMASEHIRAARARGVPEPQLLLRHAMKVALIPLTGLLGPLVAALLTGSFVVEALFALPGLGRHFVSSVLNRDHTVILGVTLLYGAVLILFNLLSDLLAAALDPRVQL